MTLRTDIIDAIDEINIARTYLHAIDMAATACDGDDGDALGRLCEDALAHLAAALHFLGEKPAIPSA